MCQKTIPQEKVAKSLLTRILLIEITFKRVADEFIRPITFHSKGGHGYILTLVSYALRYLEAESLTNIPMTAVTERLIEIYCRQGRMKY